MSESEYYLAFSQSPTIGPKRFLVLLSHFKTAKLAWYGTAQEYAALGIGGKIFKDFETYRQEAQSTIAKQYAQIKTKNIHFVAQCDAMYPKSLLGLSNPPIVLYCKGNIEVLGVPDKIAVVGSRKITSYGQDITRMFVTSLAQSGKVIVSGMALGVDAIAHDSAIEVGGITIAVLGNGVDMPYPRENTTLYKKILSSGGLIISEYPPGMQSTKGSFPARNRIIAALSKSVLVTEAGHQSGSLITADEAQKLGIPIYAIPGPITSQQSEGTAFLLKRGAILVTKPEDMLGNTTNAHQENILDIHSLPLDLKSKKVLTLLQHDSLTLDALSKKMTVPVTEISQIISQLELLGYVSQNERGEFCLNT